MSGKTPEDALPLGRVVGLVKAWVERCGWVWVEAQVIELRRRNAPTQFLTLRDTDSNVSATITCTAGVLEAAGPLVEGTVVLARLMPRVYAERAQLSFECSQLQVAGVGRLLAHIEALKTKLQSEGLFDLAKKKALPFLPRAIGLITGAESAAERDVLANTRLRWPAVRFVVRHALMQGPSSAGDVMAALDDLDADPDVDLIVIARGGGSLEDLLPFSDEGLVRAVAAAKTPVVSAIGHESDNPIIDLVADLRASTPTDAAKRIVPDVADEAHQIEAVRLRLARIMLGHLQVEQAWLDQASQRRRMALQRRLADERLSIEHGLAQIRAMSPQATLQRGYAIATTSDGAVLTNKDNVAVGQLVRVRLADGALQTSVRAIEGDNHDTS